jgi:hypothetical protein
MARNYHAAVGRITVLSRGFAGEGLQVLLMAKLQAMLRYEETSTLGGFIVSRRQQETLRDGLIWIEARSPGKEDGLDYAKKVFEEHGYEVIEWHDDIDLLE